MHADHRDDRLRALVAEVLARSEPVLTDDSSTTSPTNVPSTRTNWPGASGGADPVSHVGTD
jgi:hypothetical protein